MAVLTYFDLKSAHSYKMSGLSGRRYCFYKGKPVEVTDEEDANKFRAHTDLFFECDESGKPIATNAQHNNAKTFVTFRKHIADRDEVIEESNKQAMEQRKAGVDVNAILEEASKDAIKSESSTKNVTKKSKVAKKDKNPLECELCGYVAKDQEDLKAHLDQHSEED
ncbi:MAG: hypothetical protein K0Q47_9 [Sedimentibacter sp.]|jgi:ribosomal protein L44E|nr:hypothetical protein [Sedimentibacter sp.]